MIRWMCLGSLLLLPACDGGLAPIDAGADAPIVVDGGADDAGTDDAATDAGVADGGASDAGVVTPPPLPYYEVPTADGALAPHAFFAVPDVHYVTTAGIVTLTYDFPPDLSGVIDQPLEFTGPVDAAGNATISGAAGTGTCTVAAGIVRCTETFSAGLMLSPSSAVSMTGAYSTDPAARAARTSVIELFASDPIGVVVFDLATASEPSGGG